MEPRLVEYFNQDNAIKRQIDQLENRRSILHREFVQQYSPLVPGELLRLPIRFKNKLFKVVSVGVTSPDWWLVADQIPDVVVWNVSLKSVVQGQSYTLLIAGDSLPDYVELA